MTILGTGQGTYLYEKLTQAKSSALFAGDANSIAAVFEVLSRGIGDVEFKERTGAPVPYLADESARKNFDTIKRLISSSDEDAKHPDAVTLGTWIIRARRMTNDEKRELADAMSDLHLHLRDFNG